MTIRLRYVLNVQEPFTGNVTHWEPSGGLNVMIVIGVINLLDKVVHCLGGATICLNTYLLTRDKYSYETYISLSVLSTIFIGVAVEIFQMITGTGRFDVYDIAATIIGSWVLFGIGEL